MFSYALIEFVCDVICVWRLSNIPYPYMRETLLTYIFGATQGICIKIGYKAIEMKQKNSKYK